MNVGTLTIFLGVTTSGINKAIRDVKRAERSIMSSAGSMEEALLSLGRVTTQFLTFSLSIIGGAAAKTFSDFEHNVAKVTGLVGIAADQTSMWADELKDLAGAVGKSPKELSEALYYVTTGGIRGAETMEVMTVAAKAATAGLGETSQVADLLVSAMNAYGKENLSAARAADILVASVKEGKAEASSLAQSMGIVLPIASKLGVTFDQVGGAMAAMTRTGTKASTAAMQTRQILAKIVKPAEQSRKAIKGIGTSFEELRHIISTQGLLPALMKLNDLTKEYGIDTVASIFPNIRALSGILDILGENLDENIKSQEAITNSTGALNHAFSTISNTWKFQLNQAIREGQVLLVEIGEAVTRTLLPTLKSIVDHIRGLITSFNSLTSTQQKTIVQIGLLAAAIGPVIILFNVLKSSIVPVFTSLYLWLGKSLKELLLLDVAIKNYTKSAAVAGTVTQRMSRSLLSLGKNAAFAAGRFAMISGYVVILALLGTALVGLIKRKKEEKAVQKELNKVNEEAVRIYEKEAVTINKLVSTAQSEHSLKEMRAQAVVRLNNLSPVYLRNLTEENVKTAEGKKLIDDYVASLDRKGKAQAASAALMELERKRIEDLASGAHMTPTFWEKAYEMGIVQALTGYNIFKSTARQAQDELDAINRKSEKTKNIYETFRESYLKMIMESKYAVSDFIKQYDFLSEKVKEAEKNDRAFGKAVLDDINAQISAMDEYRDMLVELMDIALQKGDTETTFEIWIKSEDLKVVYAQMMALKTIMEAMLPTLFDFEEYTASAAGKLDELFTTLAADLDTANRKVILFGESFDLLNEQIKIYENLLNKASAIEGAELDTRVLDAKTKYENLKTEYEIIQLAADALKRLTDEEKQLTDIYKKQYGEQNKNIEALEKAQRVLSNYKMEQMFPDLVRITGSVASLEDLEKALKELEERGLTFTAQFKNISKLLETKKIDEDFNDSLAELQRNLEMTATKAELLGTNFNSTEEQLRVYQNSLSRLLRMDIGKLDAKGVEDWKKAVEEGSEAVRSFILKLELQNKVAELGSDVLWNLGEMAMGVEGAYDNLAKTLTRFTESIMKAILKELILINIKKLVAKGTKESADAKLKEAAASAVNAAASNAEAGASAANAVAKGVEEGAKLGPAMLVAIPTFLAIILGALTMASKARQNAAKMAEGGIVPQGFPNDSYPAMLTSGEMVVPPHKLPELSAGKQKIDITVHGKVKGSDIHYIVSEIDRKQRNTY